MAAPGMGPERLAQAAFWYYVQNLKQEEIARRLGVSRSNVSRILSAARESGVVRFDIRYPLSRDAELEQVLLTRYRPHGVQEIIVTAPPTSEHDRHEQAALLDVARESVAWLAANLRAGMTVGLSWGATIGTIVEAAFFPRKVDVQVVQLAGETSLDPRFSGHDLARDLANRIGGRYSYFNAPAVAPTADAAKALMQSPQVAQALCVARGADVAVIGIGAYNAATSRRFLEQADASATEQAEAERKGALGQVCGRFFDADGRQLDLELHHRVLSVDLEDLQIIPTVVAAASGADKADAVAAALRGGFVNVLVLDRALARAISAASAERSVGGGS